MSLSNKDANQVIRSVYSEADGALKTVPAGTTSFSIELSADDGDSVATRPVVVDTATSLNAVSAASDSNSAEIDMSNYRHIGVVVSAASLTGTLNGTVTIQVSNDNTIWADTTQTVTLDSANKVAPLSLSDMNYKYARIKFLHVGLATGTVTTKHVLKG